MISVILWVFSASLLVNWVEPCSKWVHSSRPSNMEHGLPYGDHKNYERKLHQLKRECGFDYSVQEKEWYVYLHVKTSNSTRRTCTGTVISDNMVVASHHCFALHGQKMQAYEAWSPYPQERVHTVARAALVHITTLLHDQIGPGYLEYVTVKDIIYNLRYGPVAPLRYEVASDADIALVIIEGTFFLPYVKDRPNSRWLREPACIPTANVKDPPPTVPHRYGFYLGLGSEPEQDPTPEERYVNEVVILGGSECDKEQGFGSYSHRDSLCIRFRAAPPIFPGGPLMTTNSEGLYNLLTDRIHTSFLLGVSTTPIKRPLGTALTYTYFGNVLKNIKYIEKIAEMYNSSWCSTPVFDENAGKATDAAARLQVWEWEQVDPREYAAGRNKDATLECTCGVLNSGANLRISNGETAIPYQFGWHIRLLIHRFFLCGGSIINDRIIVTAAHCFVDQGMVGPLVNYNETAINDVVVHVRSHYNHETIYNFTDPHSFTVEVEQIINHPGFQVGLKSSMFDSDITLLILKKPLEFENHPNKSLHVRPICIPRADQTLDLTNPKPGTLATVSGWGVVNPWAPPEQQHSSQVLQKLTVPIRPLQDCVRNTGLVMTKNMLCAGTFNESNDSTTGDSGGPLVMDYPGEKAKLLQVGIVSYGVDVDGAPKDSNGYADSEMGVYTNLAEFIPFVDYYSKKYGAKWCKY